MTWLTLAVGTVFLLLGLASLAAPKLRFFREVDAVTAEDPGTAERWAGRFIGAVLVIGGSLIIYLGQ